MSTQLRKKRTQRQDASLTVTKTDEGYRVRLPFDPAKSYLVTIAAGRLQCTCTDFQVKRGDPNYSCRHIDAVIEYDSQNTENEISDEDYDQLRDELDGDAGEAWHEEDSRQREESQAAAEDTPFLPPPNERPESIILTPASRMLIKRSLSPDGRIDSVSVELDFPVDSELPEDIRDKAASTLQLQTEIIQDFWQTTAPPPAQPASASQKGSGRTLKSAPQRQEEPQLQSALLKDIGSMNGKWGKRFFINVEVSGRLVKLFGTDKQLSAQIADAGYAVPVSQIKEGKVLNIPCLVSTKPSPDGRYLNVEQVFEEDRPKRAS